MVAALLKRCSFNVSTWGKHDQCFPQFETIAKDAGVSLRTVKNVLHRDVAGRMTYTYYGEDIGQYIDKFVRQVERRFRYSDRHCHMVRTSNLYTLAVIMPYVEADEPTVYAVFETKRSARDYLAAQARSGVMENNCTFTVGQSLPVYSSAKVALQDRNKNVEVTKEAISISARDNVGGVAIRNVITTQTGNEGTRVRESQERINIVEPNRISNHNESAAPRREVVDMPTEAVLSEREALYIDADVYAGPVIEDIALQRRDTNPRATRKHIVTAAVDAGATPEQIVDLAYLVRNRINRFNGHIVNPGAYYLSTFRNAIVEAKRSRWDVAHIAAVDEQRYKDKLQLQRAGSGRNVSGTRKRGITL